MTKEKLKRMAANASKESGMYQQYLVDNTKLLSQDVPDIPRCAIDIEVAGLENQIPDVKTAEYPIIMVSFYNNNGNKLVVALESYYKDKEIKEEYFDIDSTISIAPTEEALIES